MLSNYQLKRNGQQSGIFLRMRTVGIGSIKKVLQKYLLCFSR